MKKTKHMAGISLVFLFSTLHATCTFAGAPKTVGCLDSIVGNSIAGWVWNSETPEEPQAVTVTVIDQSTGEIAASRTTRADEYRDDLKEEGIGTGNYGFHVEVDWDSLPESTYSVSIASGKTTFSRTLQYSSSDKTVSVGKKLIPLGTFKTTAYCPCVRCSEGWGRSTSSGALAVANHTVAVDRNVIPIGSHLMIGGKEYVAEDTGGAVKGNHIDIYFDTHAEARAHGMQREEVYLIQ